MYGRGALWAQWEPDQVGGTHQETEPPRVKTKQCFQLGSQIEFQDLLGLCSPAGLDTVLHPASMRLAGDWEDLEFLGLNWQRSPPRARSGAGCSDE